MTMTCCGSTRAFRDCVDLAWLAAISLCGIARDEASFESAFRQRHFFESVLCQSTALRRCERRALGKTGSNLTNRIYRLDKRWLVTPSLLQGPARRQAGRPSQTRNRCHHSCSRADHVSNRNRMIKRDQQRHIARDDLRRSHIPTGQKQRDALRVTSTRRSDSTDHGSLA